jgi:WD40 repeat protein/energy-coupling factor transporter ATP-binding protein EcfA2
MSAVAFDLDNPFPGLRAFAEGEADRFFGRRQQIDELAARLAQSQFIAVSGNSGCGKSSLVRAGLLRELNRRAAGPDATAWRPVIMLPGNQPIANLSKALSAGLDIVSGDETRIGLLYGQLKLGGLGLAEAVRQARLAPRTRVLLVVDQFEELFRLKQADPDEASAFVKLLLNAALDAESPVSVILTLRSDSLGYCADFRGLPEAINQGQYLVPKLTRDQRKEAIIGPVELRSQRITARLVQRILNDVSDDFDDLPVMQHALSRTWNWWASVCQKSRPIDLEDYVAIGTTTDAISMHADEAAEATQRQPVVEKVFRALTERGPNGEAIRRALPFDQLCEVVGGERRDVEKVVERFRRPDTAFLRPGQDVPLASNPIVDISHESLIRQWRRLGVWVQAEAESAAILRRLLDSARRHEFQDGSLWRGPELRAALKWQKQEAPTAGWAELYAQDNGADAWQSAQQFLAASRRRAWLRRAGLAVVPVAVLPLLLVFNWLRQSQSSELANKALTSIDQDPARSARLASAAVERNSRNKLAEVALRQAMARLEVAHTVEIIEPCVLPSASITGKRADCDPVRDVRYSGDGSQLLVAAGKAVTLFDSKDFRPIGTRIERDTNVLQAWLINGNRTLVTRTDDSKAQIQQLVGSVIRPLACPSDNLVWAVTPSRDGSLVAIGCQEGEVLVWDVAEATEQPKYKFRRRVKEAATVTALDFSADGAFLASGASDGKVAVWKLGKPGVWVDHVGVGTKNRVPLAHTLAIRDVHFYEKDHNYLVTAGDDQQAIVWKLNLERAPLTKAEQAKQTRWPLDHERVVTAAQFFPVLEGVTPPVFTVSAKIAQRWVNEKNDPKQMRGHDDWVTDANVSPDGELLVTACADGTARIWSTRSGPPIAVLRGHRGGVNRAFFSPAGDAILTASYDGSVRVWQFHAPELLASLDHWALGAAFDSRGERVAVADEKGTACVLALADRRGRTCSDPSTKKLRFGHGMLSGLSWSTDAKYLVGVATPISINAQSTPMLWEIANEDKSDSVALSEVVSAVFRVGSDELLTANAKGRLALWDAKALDAPDLKPLLEFGSEEAVRGLPAISPDGLWIAASNGKDIDLWRRSDNQAAAKKLVGHRGSVRSLRFSNDSTRLLSASDDRTALIWPLLVPDKPVTLQGGHTGAVYAASFDPTDKWVVTGSADGTIGLWDAKTAHLIALLRWHGEGVDTVEFSPDGRSILSASDDGTVRLGQCETCTLPLADLKAMVPQMAKLSKDDERELQREIGR